jgi:hypothetical protein
MKYNPDIVKAYYSEHGIPEPVFEYKFHHVRKWRFDVAWVEKKLAIEIQGGIFIQGRHSRGAALLKEWKKLNEAARLGWRVIYCQPKDACTIDIVDTIRDILEAE